MYVANTASILKLEFSVEDITSDYRFLLRLVHIFTVNTEGYYSKCYKVNDTKTLKKLVVSFYALRSQIMSILAHLTKAFKNHTDLVLDIIVS